MIKKSLFSKFFFEKCILFVLTILFFSNYLYASSWNISNGYPINFSDNKIFYATVGYAQGGGANIYFQENVRCSAASMGGMSESIFFNGVLVQMGRACNGVNMYTYPITYAGINYVFSEFIYKKSVTLQLSKGRLLDTISADNFNNTYQVFVNNSGTGGGL
ncbi:hypothetical protein [Xenorhabdus bovienii]|uniref:hypothetical protein n=1 Tax=Xenorhabdus bovienii TaxID=40576 RepID=UPI0023B34902|nr:hypothetical protein [Xenorhabdus bovienii]MDE9545170.1 hypothetical protein [Xenorhabdus bovienii]